MRKLRQGLRLLLYYMKIENALGECEDSLRALRDALVNRGFTGTRQRNDTAPVS